MGRIAVLLAACLAASVALTACGSSGGGRVTLNVAPDRPETRITVAADAEQAIVEVFSPAGVGGAGVEITSATFPKKIVLRLHLRGLEELRLAYGNTVVRASISSDGGNSISQHQIGAGASAAQQPLSATSPYWMPIRIVPAGTAPATIPLQDGAIEVEAPQDLIAGGQTKFAIQWIDFYR
jgi:hypothetical protein